MRTLMLAVAVLVSLACQTTKKSGPPPASGGQKNQPAQTQDTGPKVPPVIAEIAELEDRRSFGEGKLLTLALTANDPAVRQRALLALGRIQDPLATDTLVKGLTDPDAAARSEAAFAMGLLGLSWSPLTDEVKNKLADGLKGAEAEEADLPVKLTMLEALGRVGTPSGIDRLVDRLSVAGDVQARAALSLGVAAKGGVALPGRAFAALAALLKKEAPPVTRYGAAYALAQSKNGAARTYLLLCTNDDASEIRAICARGLGEKGVGTDVDAVTLKKLLDDPDYRVAVEATRSLAKLANRCQGPCAPIAALADLSFRAERLLRGDAAGGGQVILALAQQGLPMAGRKVLMDLRQQLLNGVRAVQNPHIRADIANVECRIAAALDKQTGTLQEVLNCGGNLIPEPTRLSMALGELASSQAGDVNKRVAEFGSYVFHNDSRVKVAALRALGESKSSAAVEKVRTQLLNPDPVVAAAAAEAAGKLGDKQSITTIRGLAVRAQTMPDIAPTVAEALDALDAKEAIPELEAWLRSTHATIRASAASALAKLKGTKEVMPPRVERPVDAVKPPNLAKEAKLIIKTEKGEFEVKLYTVEAPLTALNMYTLARKNFFKGLTFHRVVPDFVVQGGDPRGDGEGGPGYTIRCEVNHKVYARGVVGMALSGKDTGGSQFFVTAAPQPHLDGRYTSFGEVTKGQEIVDSLLEGDKILDVRASP